MFSPEFPTDPKIIYGFLLGEFGTGKGEKGKKGNGRAGQAISTREM
jgi:hypothetical protein